MVINLIGEQYFDTNFRNSALEHKDWFTEFASLFSFKNKKQLNEKFIYPRVQDCLSQKCGTRKSANNKEGFKDFKDVFYAIFLFKKYLHVQDHTDVRTHLYGIKPLNGNRKYDRNLSNWWLLKG